MAISVPVQRVLLAHSGGYCANPGCHADFFIFFESGRIATVEELAHVIGQSDSGPRGDPSLPEAQRDEYENIILLCPSCHTLIDKVPAEFPVRVLREWKSHHKERISGLFRAPAFTSRADLRQQLHQKLKRTRAIFDMYGPHSAFADNPMSDAVDMWRQRVVDTIIPTNRFVVDLLDRNVGLLDDGERQVLEKFRLHVEGLEYNHLSGDKNAAVPLFPLGMNEMLADA